MVSDSIDCSRMQHGSSSNDIYLLVVPDLSSIMSHYLMSVCVSSL